METYSSIPEGLLETGGLRRARVVGTTADGRIRVRDAGPDHVVRECDVLITRQDSALPPPGAEVLAWFPPDDQAAGIVLGVVGRAAPAERHSDSPPDTLLLEAKESLTLRVGDGSITIRADGKILIKGKDLVSHAQNVNRIKGGAVAIN
jgi:hypothetical protein